MGVYNLGEMIRVARTQYGISAEKLTDGICAVETLKRIEKGERAPRRKTYEKLMERLEMPREKYYFILQGEDLKFQEERRWISKKIFQQKMEEALKALEEMEKYIQKDNIYNMQCIINKKIICKSAMNQISKEQAIEEYKEAFYLTKKYKEIDHIKITCLMLNYTETNIQVNIATSYWEIGQKKKAIDILSLLKQYYKKNPYNIRKNHANIIWVNLANMLGKLRKYDECIEICKEGLEIEKQYELGMLTGRYFYYMAVCELQKSVEQGITDSKKLACCKDQLQQAYLVASTVDDTVTMNIIKKCFDNLEGYYMCHE